MLKTLQKAIDTYLEDPTRLISKRFSPTPSCSQVNNDKGGSRKRSNERKYSSEKITVWSFDMDGHAETCFERFCELAKKDVSSLHKVATRCIDDYQIPPEDSETTWELSAVCVLRLFWNACTWPRIGRPEFFMVSEYSGTISNKRQQSLWQKVATIVEMTSIKPRNAGKSVIWEVKNWNAREAIRLIHILTMMLLSPLTTFRSTFPTPPTQPNPTCSKTMRHWSKWSTKEEVQAWGMSQERTEPIHIGCLSEWVWIVLFLIKCGINTLQRCWNQAAFWVIAWHRSNWEIMSLYVHKTAMKTEENVVQVEYPSHILRDKTGLRDNWCSRQWKVENARGSSSRLLRFRFMCGKAGV